MASPRALRFVGVAVLAMHGFGLCAQPRQADAAAVPAPASSGVRLPTPAEMDAQRIRMPSPAELDRQPAVVMPRLDTPTVPLQPGIDAGALAAQYEALRGAAGQGAERQGKGVVSGLLVFVTLQMPKASLRRLAEQAERAQATLVLRGLRNSSMKDTLAEVADLIGPRKVAWLIDPEAFKRFGVVLAPSFVLVAPQGGSTPDCAAGQCNVPPVFAKVVGDVSTVYALQAIERGDPAVSALARVYRARLETRR